MHSSRPAIFEFSANDNGGSKDKGVGIKQIECSIDNSNFTASISPVEITPNILTDGNHTFKIELKTMSETINPAPASFNWTIRFRYHRNLLFCSAIDGNESIVTDRSEYIVKSYII